MDHVRCSLCITNFYKFLAGYGILAHYQTLTRSLLVVHPTSSWPSCRRSCRRAVPATDEPCARLSLQHDLMNLKRVFASFLLVVHPNRSWPSCRRAVPAIGGAHTRGSLSSNLSKAFKELWLAFCWRCIQIIALMCNSCMQSSLQHPIIRFCITLACILPVVPQNLVVFSNLMVHPCLEGSQQVPHRPPVLSSTGSWPEATCVAAFHGRGAAKTADSMCCHLCCRSLTL